MPPSRSSFDAIAKSTDSSRAYLFGLANSLPDIPETANRAFVGRLARNLASSVAERNAAGGDGDATYFD
jgi:hypothetical protein